jgi:hypothetical protein
MFKKVIRHPETGEIQGIETPEGSGALAAATRELAAAIREASGGISRRAPGAMSEAAARLPAEDGFSGAEMATIFLEAVDVASVAYTVGMDAGVREAAAALGAESGSVVLKTVPDVRAQLAEMLGDAVTEAMKELAALPAGAA